MTLCARTRTALFSALLLLPLLSLTAQAAGTRYTLTTGTSSGSGSITIETLSKPIFPGRLGPQGTETIENAHITVPSGFNCDQTAAMIADSLNAQLSGNFSSMVHPMHPAVVQIDYLGGGPFTGMTIVDSVPGQITQEVPAGGIPTLTGWGLILLALLIVASGAFMMLRRRRSAASGIL